MVWYGLEEGWWWDDGALALEALVAFPLGLLSPAGQERQGHPRPPLLPTPGSLRTAR